MGIDSSEIILEDIKKYGNRLAFMSLVIIGFIISKSDFNNEGVSLLSFGIDVGDWNGLIMIFLFIWAWSFFKYFQMKNLSDDKYFANAIRSSRFSDDKGNIMESVARSYGKELRGSRRLVFRDDHLSVYFKSEDGSQDDGYSVEEHLKFLRESKARIGWDDEGGLHLIFPYHWFYDGWIFLVRIRMYCFFREPGYTNSLLPIVLGTSAMWVLIFKLNSWFGL